MEYQLIGLWASAGFVGTAFANGFFEEILWRGVYMELFPQKNFWRIVWPSLWFALWHYAPGSISTNNQLITLIIGAGFLGFYNSWVAKKTGTIWWSMVIHTTGGLILALS
jgi:membrane protease YdiL (CAAX protease family)